VTSSPIAARSVNLWRPRFRLIIADPDLMQSQEVLFGALDRHGIDIDVCGNGGEALLRAAAHRPDVAVVAADAGELDAAAVVRLLTEKVRVPVLVGIGAGEDDRAGAALDAGAIGCVARPYIADELLPYLRSIRPEAVIDAEDTLHCGSLYLDNKSLEVWLRDSPVRLPLREFDLLRYFMAHADRLVTRKEIWTAVWGDRLDPASNTLTVHIKRLRNRLGDDRTDPRIILTIRGLGYRFVPPI
jgi:DNA-binding response OmpR family regulator